MRLNACKNRANIALLGVTAQSHDQSVVFVNGKPHSNSWLDLERKAIPTLTHEEIVLEVQRKPLSLMRADQDRPRCNSLTILSGKTSRKQCS